MIWKNVYTYFSSTGELFPICFSNSLSIFVLSCAELVLVASNLL